MYAVEAQRSCLFLLPRLPSRAGRRSIFSSTRWLKPATTVYAHCDVPCGIYDPHQAELAPRTVARMVELIGQLPAGRTETAARQKFVRCIAINEQHAETVKHEIQMIWSGYFKPEHLERDPDLHGRTWKILKLASKNKQNVDAVAAAELEAAVKEFSDIFWSTKKQPSIGRFLNERDVGGQPFGVSVCGTCGGR